MAVAACHKQQDRSLFIQWYNHISLQHFSLHASHKNVNGIYIGFTYISCLWRHYCRYMWSGFFFSNHYQLTPNELKIGFKLLNPVHFECKSFSALSPNIWTAFCIHLERLRFSANVITRQIRRPSRVSRRLPTVIGDSSRVNTCKHRLTASTDSDMDARVRKHDAMLAHTDSKSLCHHKYPHPFP